jgi:biopolymer transport protein ExbD
MKLERAGIGSSSDALEAELSKESVSEPHAGLANRVASMAVVEFGAVSTATTWWLSLVRILTSPAATTGAFLVGAALLVAWQHQQNNGLRAQIDRRRGQSETVRQLDRENRKLALNLSKSDDLRRSIAIANGVRPSASKEPTAGEPLGSRLNINVTSEGRIAWEKENVDLQGFLKRLVETQSNGSGNETQLVVHGAPGSAFSETAYVVEQASKAGFKNITIDSQASPGPSDGWVTATPGSFPTGDRAPPTLPDAATKP